MMAKNIDSLAKKLGASIEGRVPDSSPGVFGAPPIVPPTPEEDSEIIAAAKADPDAQPLTDAQLAAMVPMRPLRGRPKSNHSR